MQCEVCGSTSIKKVDETTFECQNCGVQYSVEEAKRLLVEITGAVKIDHSDEVKNNIERGDQYVENGNAAKAKEYYNKALDLDANNIEAKEKVEKASENEKFEDYYIIKPDIKPEDNVKDFLKQLATTDNVACDIYKEIKIERVTEKFYTFMLMEGNYRCDWSLTACHKYYENETVYKEKYNPSTGKYYKEPETQKVERIERVPMQGTKVYDAKQLALGSKNLNKDISFVPDGFATQLVENFLQLQTEKYHQYDINKVDVNTLEKENGIFTYNNIPLDTYVNDGCFINSRDQMQDNATQKAADEVMAGIDCDFCEGISATSEILSLNVNYICFPVQIIEYTYKDKKYVAISDLLSRTTTIPMVYPCDVKLANALEELNNQKQKASNSSAVIAGLVISGIGLLFLFLGNILPGTEGFFIPLMLVFLVAGLSTMFIGFIVQNSRTKKFENNAQDIKRTLFNPRVNCLETSRDKFFEEYTDYASAEQAAAQFDCIVVETIRPEVSCAGEIRKKMAYVTSDEVDIDDTTSILEYGIKSNKQKRNKRICVSLFGGIILGVLGVLIFGSGVWHYSIWFLALLMTVLGFGFATIGSIIIMGNSNREIIDLQNCLTMYKKQKTLENEFEQPQELVVLPILKQWTPERIEQKVAELSNKKETIDAENSIKQDNNIFKNIVGWIKEHKKLSITVAVIILVFLVSIIAETIVVNLKTSPYENSLTKNSYVYKELDSHDEYVSGKMIERKYQYIETYTFFANGTYKKNSFRAYLDTGKQSNYNEYEGSYKVRYELFSNNLVLVLDNSSFEMWADEKNIYEFEVYGDLYKISDGDNITNDVLSNDSSTNNNSTENTTSSPTSTNNEESHNTNSSESSDSNPNNSSTQSNNNSSTVSKPSTSTQSNSKPTVAKDPCEDGHSWKDATCTTPATCSVCKKTSGKALGHELYIAKCINCGQTDYSKLAGTYTDVGGWYSGTDEDVDMASFTINTSGILSFELGGQKYSFKVVQVETSYYDEESNFVCYSLNGNKETDIKIRVTVNHYISYPSNEPYDLFIFHFNWDYFNGQELYFSGEKEVR